jgi:prepilin-type N-terminal cleavage/methylation domain-containing protein
MRQARSEHGFTLVEVLVAMVILLIAIGGVYAALLTAVTGSGSNEQRYQANLASRELSETLKNYVTGSLADVPGAPGSPAWHLPGDACTSCPGGADCWALAACTHDATAQLSPSLRAAGVRMSYAVEHAPAPGGGPLVLPHVTIHVDTP